MVLLKSCCFWKSLKKGCIASGSYTLIFYTIVLIASVFNLDAVIEVPVLLTFSIVMVVSSGICVLSCMLLFVGLCVDNRIFLLPWIVSVPVATLVDLFVSLYLLDDVSSDPGVIILFAVDFITFILNVYCLLCVISKFQEYSEDRRNHPLQIPPSVRFQQNPTGILTVTRTPALSLKTTQATVILNTKGIVTSTPTSSTVVRSRHSTELSSLFGDPIVPNNIKKQPCENPRTENILTLPEATSCPSENLDLNSFAGNSYQSRIINDIRPQAILQPNTDFGDPVDADNEQNPLLSPTKQDYASEKPDTEEREEI
ncbi:uncharacterized protein LOC111085379 [Limulus polyphemus]|uniref:Uncharacterized protein LOC111085379 n=1 Tax=Limulus polyphemus TaxID=6850 RepID=A0ABM1S6W8_LIMPO|nr:uncharacterized protein LOC111085379 [Limulus polyphemus]